MRLEHTPGPWSAIKGAEQGDDMRCAVVANRGNLAYLVATIENGAPGDWCDTEYANALLMAASPELLKALRKARNTLAGIGMTTIAADICDAAIAAATGEV